MANQDLLKLGKEKALINKISNLYEKMPVDEAITNFQKRLEERVKKINLKDFDICYSFTFIYKQATLG